jgi:hypothetical protein
MAGVSETVMSSSMNLCVGMLLMSIEMVGSFNIHLMPNNGKLLLAYTWNIYAKEPRNHYRKFTLFP